MAWFRKDKRSSGQRKYFLPALIFFLITLIVGSLAFDDYGFSWDELNQVHIGEGAYDHIFYGNPWPEKANQRVYGTSFELPATILTHSLPLTEGKSIMLLRHFLNFLYFFVGVYFFYLLGKLHFRSEFMGLLGAFFLVVSPRIFADAFYNSKDLPNLALFIIAMYTLVRLLEKPTLKRAVLHAIASALAISIRLTALIMLPLTIGIFALHWLLAPNKKSVPLIKTLRMLSLYLGLVIVCTIAAWPYLWGDPVGRFIEAYHFMSSLGVETFYMGTMISALPWHYVFVWIGITTPLLYTLLFLTGLGSFIGQALRNPIVWLRTHENELLFLLWFFLPIAAIYITGAGIFDGWRHLYFIYPAFLLIALHGVRWLWRGIRRYETTKGKRGLPLRTGFILSIILPSLVTIVWMIRNHPLQNVYFSLPNFLVERNFELDYWGLSYRKALEYLLAHDPDPVITIHPTSSPGYTTINMLPESQIARLKFVEEDQAKYVIDNFRRDNYKKLYPDRYAIYSVTVNGMPVNTIYQQPLLPEVLN